MTIRTLSTPWIAAALLIAAVTAWADDKHAQHGASSPATTAAATEMVDGEVRRVSKGSNKITIKHGPIKHLDMPGMTMAFGVSDPALLERVKKGDRVRFTVREIDGEYTVTDMQPQ